MSAPAIRSSAIVWQGPSQIDGAPIVAIATGLDGSTHNPKTGPMAQLWILPESGPFQGQAHVCGTCPLRPDLARAANAPGCYVNLMGPQSVWRAWREGKYLPLVDDGQRFALALRLGAWGDPAAVPYQTLERLVARFSGWTGYTHQWREADARFARLLMASLDNPDDRPTAHAAGYRTFRAKRPEDALLSREILCPATPEGGMRATCATCQLCTGRHAAGVADIAVYVHGASAGRGVRS